MAAMIPEKSAISPHVTALRVLVMPTLLKYKTLCPKHRVQRN